MTISKRRLWTKTLTDLELQANHQRMLLKVKHNNSISLLVDFRLNLQNLLQMTSRTKNLSLKSW